MREILKQNRFAPLPIEFQLAWLVAYNDGLFDEINLDLIPLCLGKIEQQIKSCDLTLASLREQWKNSVGQWLGEWQRDQKKSN